MKYIPEAETVFGKMPMVELTRRNLQALIDKLDDPNSQRTLIDPDYQIAVKAVCEDQRVIIDDEHQIAVKPVEDSEHYKTRRPGLMLIHGKLK